MRLIFPIVFVLVLGLLCAPISTKAAHLVGGELNYQCLGGDSYQINLTIYRDCNCTDCADFDDPANVTVFDADGGFVNNFFMSAPFITNVPISTEGLCVETAPDVCVEEGVYSETITLPSIPGGYQIAYQRCCRNNTIVNLVDPGSTGSTYLVHIPETNDGCQNNSAVFTNFPPIVICADAPLLFDHSAIDLDGDSLVYSLCDPSVGASTLDPAPIVASAPPYAPVNWAASYSADNPVGGEPQMNIDSVTGELTAFPNLIGQFVVGICVTEFRDGVAINTSIRDFQFNVADCAIVLAEANTIGDVSICLGETVELDANINGADEAYWSPEDGLSNPNSLTPTVTPTETVSYVLSAINSLTGCFDTDTVTITVSGAPTIDAGEDQQICAGESVGIGTLGDLTYSWTPTETLDDPTSATPMASPSVTTVYTVVVTNADGCTASDEVAVNTDLESDPGTMPSDMQLMCYGESTDVITNDESVAEGHLLVYVLHTSSTNVLGTILATSSQADGGTFNLDSNSAMASYTTYYISAIAGPDDGNGFPDVTNACTQVNVGTPVVFFDPVELFIDENCDYELTGNYAVIVYITGGYPSYDPNATYNVVGDYMGAVAAGEPFLYYVAGGGDNLVFTFEVLSDGFGCTTPEFTSEPFDCNKTPIELLSFRGLAKENGNLILWETATEIDNDYFNVQRSFDAQNFETITTIKGQLNSTTVTSYDYLDLVPSNGIAYYRLIQVDLNGQETLSNTISVLRTAQQGQLSLSPVPSKSVLNVQFDAVNDVVLRIYDTTGKVLNEKIVAVNAFNNNLILTIDNYPEGMYILSVNDGVRVQTAKFVKGK